MKFIKQSFSYMFKNYGYIFLMCIIPVAFIGSLNSPFKIIEFFNVYPTAVVNNFGDVFTMIFSLNWLSIILSILGLIIISLFLSLIIGQMENHMRSGKNNFKNMFSYVNNNILVVAVNILVLALIYFGLMFLLGCLVFLLHLMFSGMGSAPTVINSIFSIILTCAFCVLYLFIGNIFMINIPNMIINGYSFKHSLSVSIQLINKNSFKLFIAFLLPFVIIIPLVSLLLNTGVGVIANLVGMILICSYYPSLIMTSYFDLSDTARYDNRKYYNFK